jgi:hypothetical protein
VFVPVIYALGAAKVPERAEASVFAIIGDRSRHCAEYQSIQRCTHCLDSI